VSIKSNSCFSKRTGEPLTEYYSEGDAWEGAEYANNQYGNNLIPYQCKKCEFWHLSPKDRQTPSQKCFDCTDGSGKCKRLYYSEEDAERRADILYEEEGVNLEVYECPHNDGWHLTKG
jgi:hypothetical protein